jgi:hypothetical protein
LVERGLTLRDAHHAIEKPKNIEPYAGDERNGGTGWRVRGRDIDNRQDVVVGVEAFIDSEGRRVILCTLFAVEVKP